MAIKPGFQEKHPNSLIWILFSLSFMLFIIGVILYAISVRKLIIEEDPVFNYWPVIDALFRFMPHILTCTVFKLCRFCPDKSVVLALHVLLGIGAFLGSIFANEHMIYKGNAFNITAFIELAVLHEHIPKDPIIWTITTWLEFLYVSFLIIY